MTTPCSYCLNKGYVSILGWRAGEERKLIPCDCKHGRAFEKMWRKESPPIKAKARPVNTEWD